MKKKCDFCYNENIVSTDMGNYEVCPHCLNKALSDYFKKIEKKNKFKDKAIPPEVMNYRIGFGKFKGKALVDVDANYLKWCLENFNGLRDVEIFKTAYEAMSGQKFSSRIAAVYDITEHQRTNVGSNTDVNTADISKKEEDIFPF